MLEYEDLSGVVLVGHSYGGMVATGVADRARERIRQLIYLDAFVPRRWLGAGRPCVSGGTARGRALEAIDGWRIQPPRPPPDITLARGRCAQVTARRMTQPMQTSSDQACCAWWAGC